MKLTKFSPGRGMVVYHDLRSMDMASARMGHTEDALVEA